MNDERDKKVMVVTEPLSEKAKAERRSPTMTIIIRPETESERSHLIESGFQPLTEH